MACLGGRPVSSCHLCGGLSLQSRSEAPVGFYCVLDQPRQEGLEFPPRLGCPAKADDRRHFPARPVRDGLVVLGEMTIQGNILPVRSRGEPLQVIWDNGAKRVLVPVSNRRQFLEVPSDIIERVDSIFYSEPLSAALKALGMG